MRGRGQSRRAEDALADTFAAALSASPARGVPESADAWLLTVARRRLLDLHRRRASAGAAGQELARRAGGAEPGLAEAPEAIPDHRLALLLACAGPEVEPAARAPLMLQCVLGLDGARIASAFLAAPAAMSLATDPALRAFLLGRR